jgi:hypothetical protein
MQPEQMRLRHIVAYVIGGVEGLLLARLVLRLFAARPDNPFVPVFLGATAPLVAPLEISTLALVALLALAGAAIRMLARSADRRTQ